MTNPCDLDYQNRTYENLSQEFKELCRTAVRAFQLIPMMYNRLTLIDGLSHSEAWMKICRDHKDLPGFSRRNIYRYLPSDNPNIPRRVVPSRHKSANMKIENEKTGCIDTDTKNSQENILIESCPSCNEFKQINIELEKT